MSTGLYPVLSKILNWSFGGFEDEKGDESKGDESLNRRKAVQTRAEQTS